MERVSLGNETLRFAVDALYACWAVGAAAILEHPAPPSTPGGPSIWQLPEIVRLAQLDAVEVHDFEQCCFGAPAPTPTRLLAVGAPGAGRRLRAMPAHGRLRAGTPPTAPDRQYPPQLCQFLVGAVADAVLERLGAAAPGWQSGEPAFEGGRRQAALDADPRAERPLEWGVPADPSVH